MLTSGVSVGTRCAQGTYTQLQGDTLRMMQTRRQVLLTRQVEDGLSTQPTLPSMSYGEQQKFTHITDTEKEKNPPLVPMEQLIRNRNFLLYSCAVTYSLATKYFTYASNSLCSNVNVFSCHSFLY